METIEERAIKFVDAPCDRRCEDCSTGQSGCRFYTDEVSFIYGARSEHAELTRWHDPKEDMPQEDTVVLCKVNYCKYTQYLVLNWYNGRWWFYIPYSASNVFDSDNDTWREFNGEVVGWREIGE